jgi:hypothetical protein
MYPLLGPLTRDIVCRLHQFVAAGMTGISAKLAKLKSAVFHSRRRATTVKIYSSNFPASEQL